MRDFSKSWRQLQSEKLSTSKAEKIFSLVLLLSIIIVDFFILEQYLIVKFG